MRVKYGVTTDLKDVPSGVHFHLSKFLGERSVDSNLKYVMDLVIKNELNFSLALKKIGELRGQLGKLDILLEESSKILEACYNYENGVSPPAETVPTSEPPLQAKEAQLADEAHTQTQPSAAEPAPKRENADRYMKHEHVENRMAQLGNLIETLNKMRNSTTLEPSSEQEGTQGEEN